MQVDVNDVDHVRNAFIGRPSLTLKNAFFARTRTTCRTEWSRA
jgi:hypothetical protein